MALWFRLNINADQIGVVEIRRREVLDLDDPAVADEWCTYDVRRNSELVGQVRHRYGDGAWRLLALAAELLDEIPDVYADIDNILAPVKAANPGISNNTVAGHLPAHLRSAFWRRAIDRHLADEFAELDGVAGGSDV